MNGIIGKKLGMTGIFDGNGKYVPVTIIEAGPCVIVGTKTQKKEGYSAVILAYGKVKEKRLNNAQKKLFEKIKVEPRKTIKEMRMNALPECKVGDIVGASIFKVGDYVDISGTTKGKGFQGGVKRWKWAGGEASHGSMFHRAPGSIGASSFPSRVFKGQHLPGHMGADTRTAESIEVVLVDQEKNIIAVKGSVPGFNGALLTVKTAKKRKPKVATEEAAKTEKKQKK